MQEIHRMVCAVHARCGTSTGASFDGAENCGCPAVAVHRRSSAFFSCRRGSSPWSSLFGRPQRFRSRSHPGNGVSGASSFRCRASVPRCRWRGLCCEEQFLVVDVPVVRVVQILCCCRGEGLGAPTVAAHLRNRRSLCSDCRKLRIFRSRSSSRSSISCRDAEAHPHGPCDHRDSPVAIGHGGQCSYFAGRLFPVVAQRRLPMVFQTIETPQLPLDTVVDVPVFLVVRVPQLPVMEETVVQLINKGFYFPVVAQ